MSAITKYTRSPRARAAGAAVLVGGMLTYVAVAGAAADQTIRGEGAGTGSHWTPADVSVETGDTVTWEFITESHNLVSTNASPTDPRWEPLVYPGPGEFTPPAPVGDTTEYTFYKSGTYTFVCAIHGAGMSGTVTVTGEDKDIPVETPTPTPTPTATPTAPPTTTPVPPPAGDPPADDHTTTPAPTPTADTEKPALSGVKLKGRKRAAKLTFKLSESATVTVQVRKRGSKKVVRTVSLQARAGTRSYVIRSSKLRKGRYTVTLVARDAMGNKSAASNAALRIRK